MNHSIIFKSLDYLGFPKYLVGENGTIWRWIRSKNKWKKLQANPSSKKTYPMVTLCHKGHKETHQIHSLVLKTFVGPCPEGMEGCHKNGDRHDNQLSNLRWDTHKNNGKDMIGHNRSLKGSRNHFAKLDEEKVKQLRNLHSNFGWKISQLSQKYQLHPRHVKGIIKRKFWKHVT